MRVAFFYVIFIPGLLWQSKRAIKKNAKKSHAKDEKTRSVWTKKNNKNENWKTRRKKQFPEFSSLRFKIKALNTDIKVWESIEPSKFSNRRLSDRKNFFQHYSNIKEHKNERWTYFPAQYSGCRMARNVTVLRGGGNSIVVVVVR